MNEEKLKKFYENGAKHFNLPDFETFKTDMQDDAKLERYITSMSKHYNVASKDVVKEDLFGDTEVIEEVKVEEVEKPIPAVGTTAPAADVTTDFMESVSGSGGSDYLELIKKHTKNSEEVISKYDAIDVSSDDEIEVKLIQDLLKKPTKENRERIIAKAEADVAEVSFKEEDLVNIPEDKRSSFEGKSNPQVQGVGIHDHMFAGKEMGEDADLSSFDDVFSSKTGQTRISQMQQYLQEAYPDYSFKKDLPAMASMAGLSDEAETLATRLVMSAPNGDEIELATGRVSSPLDIKTKIVDFIDTHGIDNSAYQKLYFKQKEGVAQVDAATAITPEQQEKYLNKFDAPDLFDETVEVITTGSYTSPTTGISSGGETKVIKNEPYKVELEETKTLLQKMRDEENKLLSSADQLPEVTEQEVQDYTRQRLITQEKAKLKSDNLTNYLEENEDEKQAIFKYYAKVSKDKKFVQAVAAQTVFDDLVNKKDNFSDLQKQIRHTEESFNDPTYAYVLDGETVTLENGKEIPKKIYNNYTNNIQKLVEYDQQINNAYKEVETATDKLNDVDLQLELLGKDYGTWRKFKANIGTGFSSIGMGIAYGLGKASQGMKYLEESARGVEHTESDMIGAGLDMIGAEFTDWKQETMSNYANDVRFDDAFSSINKFGRFFTQEMGQQIPILTTIITTGGTASPFVLGAYSMGEKYMEMDLEDIRSGKERSEWEKFGVSLGYGASEAILGTLPTTRILGRGRNYIDQAMKRGVLKPKDYIKMGFKEQLPRVMVYEPLLESSSEGLTQISQNLLDGKPIMENVDHAMFSGGMFGFMMSSSPVMAGMVMAKYQTPADYKKFNENTSQLAEINNFLQNTPNISPAVEKNLQKQKSKVEQEINESINEIEDLVLNQMSPRFFNQYKNLTVEQERLREEAQDILESNDFKNDPSLKNKIIDDLNKQFNDLQFKKDLVRNHKSFANEFALLENGTEAEQLRYQELKTQAEENVRSKKNESPDFIPSNKDVMDEAYNLYTQDNIETRINSAKRSNGVNFEVARTNQDAKDAVNNAENIDDKQKEEIIAKIDAGTLNGVDDLNGKSYVFMENAISNERTSTIIHEPGHQVFKKILGNGQADFIPMVGQIASWLEKTDPEMLNVIILKQSKSGDDKINSEEFVMEFLEQVDQGNINFDKTNNKRLASLFGYMASDVMSDNGGFNLELKGQADAVNFLVNLAAKIRTGTLTKADIEAAKESDVIKLLKVDKTKKASIKKSIDLTKEQESRNLKYKNIFEDEFKNMSKQEYKEYMLEDGVPLSEGGVLTPEGNELYRDLIVDFKDQILQVAKFDPEVAAATVAGPFLQHLLALDPQVQLTAKAPIAGYMSAFLPFKTGTAKKQVEKGKTPQGKSISIDEQVEGRKQLELTADEKTITPKQELNFRNKLKIETGGELYKSVLKKAKIVLSTLSTRLTVPKTNTTLKDVKEKIEINPNDNKAITELNKIYKSFRQTLKNAFDTQLFKEIKNSMGTRQAYNEYLKSNKKAILTGLPIADLVAMQKAKGANKILVKTIKENLSPNEIKAYESSQNLMYVSPTSGPTLYQRLDPTDKEFVDFFNVRGRKDALAKNIAGKLGEDATMETLENKDIVESFLTKNPTLKEIPTGVLKNSIAAAIDSGIQVKFSEESQKIEYLKHADTFLDNLKKQNLGSKRNAIASALYKTYINDNSSDVWGKTLKEKEKTLSTLAKDLVNPINKYLTKEEKIGSLPNVGEFTMEEIAQTNIATNLMKVLGLKGKIKSFTEAFEDPFLITFQRSLEADYIQDLVKRKGKVEAVRIALSILKGHNATSGKIGGGRYQIFEGLEDFVNSTLNTIPGIDIKIGYDKGGKGFVESITIDKKVIPKFESRESQKSKSKEHFEKTFDKREKEADEAWETLTDYLDFMHKNGNKLSFGMTMMSLKSNMDSMLKAAALAKYYYVGPAMKSTQLRYEHMIPTEYIVMKLTQHFNGKKIDLKALKDKYNVAVVPKSMDKNFDVQFQKVMPSTWNETMSETERYFNELMMGYPNMYALEIIGGKNKGKIIGKEFIKLSNQKAKVKQLVNIPLVNESRVVKASEDMSMEDVLNKAASLDEALRNARDPKAPVKKIRVFDFDDTLARTKSNVLYTMPDGTTGKLTAEEFAQKGDEMLAEGAVWDFSEFNKVMDGKKGPLFEVAKKIQEARGADDIFVLTARAPEASPAIKEFLDAIGLNIPLKNISGLGNSSPFAKSNWIVDKAAEGYNDFYFADDHTANVKAVRDALEVLDIKSKTQQAKIKFSEDMSMDFNTILEESKGVDRFKIYSDVKAQLTGARKGRGKFFIPPSAEDFQGLLYATLGKGKQGIKHMQFYDKALLKPYAQAMENLATDRVNLMADFKALKKELDVPKDLQKATKSGFTNEQAVRVYLWAKTGQEIPGISKADFKELNDIVENDPKLKVFADQILSITKGDGYSKPGKNWTSGTITTDLVEILNTTKRTKYLQTWQANVDLIFSKDNMNKLESIFGPKYVEALRNSLSRMKAGRNRIEGGNRLSNRVLDYINNSTGAIMFFNMRSALLQTISAANFINWSFNNPLKAGKAFANQPQYWKDFKELMNSDYLVDRRNGLKLNINESEIADAAKTSKNKAKAVISYIIEKGYIPTKFADSFAIATGGATFYRNRINDLMKNEGKTEAEAKKQAMEEFRRTSEISQQSSDPSKISQQQSTDLGRVVLQFVNTPMQYARIQKRAAQDIINRRGDDKTNVSKIIYYAFLQNMIFNALQSGLFAIGFGDDDELSENDEKKIFRSANGMMDSWLRGLGFAGVTVQVLKNLGIDIYDRSKRDRPEYVDAWQKLLEFSPAIKSKLSKIKGAAYPFDSKKRRAEVFDKGFSLDNPAYESVAKVITATTNIPLDRLFTKVNNIKGALDEDQEAWQSVAMILGWPSWQVQDNSGGDDSDDDSTKSKKKKPLKKKVKKKQKKKKQK